MKISILGSSRAMRALVLGFAAPATFWAMSSLALTSAVVGGLAGCASTGTDNHVTVLKGTEAPPAEVGGIPPDKQAEIQLLLQQRDSATTKCYADVLNEKHD